MTYSSTSTPPMSYAQGVPFSSSMNLGLGNLGNLGNLGLGGLGGLGLNKGKADSVFGPVNFKFVKDDEFEMRSQASPSRSAWGDLAGFPPPAESNHMQEANRLDMEIAAHDQKVRDLASQPLTVENLETQIQELLDGQESLRYELRQVKMQVEQNAHDLEGLRRQTGDAAFAGSGYGTQYLPPTAVSQPMPPMAMPQSAAPPTMPRMSTPQMSQPPAMAPSREVPPVPVSPQQSHQSHHSRSQRVSLPAKRHKDAVHAMMGYNEDTLDLQSTTDYFSLGPCLRHGHRRGRGSGDQSHTDDRSGEAVQWPCVQSGRSLVSHGRSRGQSAAETMHSEAWCFWISRSSHESGRRHRCPRALTGRFGGLEAGHQ